ncbi:DoxX family protein [Candidatus Sumerlaeota bacterium]|nr:DoxX family protein [Candidatus Sumerlaeota bacterium]
MSKMKIAGWIMSILPAALLFFSASMKFTMGEGVKKGFEHLEIPERLAAGLGVLEISCTIIYLIPPTSVLGAILLTGYLGGAVLTHLRVGDPFLIPAALGVVIWGGLFLRDARIRELIPIRRMLKK